MFFLVSSEADFFEEKAYGYFIEIPNLSYWWKSRYFFSPSMWHHAGRPTTGHWTEAIEANSGATSLAKKVSDDVLFRTIKLQLDIVRVHPKGTISVTAFYVWNGSLSRWFHFSWVGRSARSIWALHLYSTSEKMVSKYYHGYHQDKDWTWILFRI